MGDLGDRMKRYESVTQAALVPRVPVLVRVDGKAFQTLTRGMEKPWDAGFMDAMWETAKYLCEEIQGCRVAYVQSDEISFLLIDYQNIKTSGWFDYNLQKVASVSAGIASAKMTSIIGQIAVFDSRAWNLPAHEVTNYFIWRQQDATRNSITGLALAHFSHKQLHGKTGPQKQDMLTLEKGVNWNDCTTPQKRGVCIYRETFEIPETEPPVIRHRWVVDEDIPVFTTDREYTDKFLVVNETETP